MKYRILSSGAKTRKQKRQTAIKWILYSASMLLFYVIMRTGLFDVWQPVFMIPLCVAVAMYEEELPGCVFALFGGYLLDIAFDFLFGFSVIWLMSVCLMSTLLVRNLIRANMFNFFLLSAAAVFLEFSMHYLFNVFIWNIPGGNVILTHSIIPTAVSTVIVSPLMFLLVRTIYAHTGGERVFTDYSANDEKEKVSDSE